MCSSDGGGAPVERRIWKVVIYDNGLVTVVPIFRLYV